MIPWDALFSFGVENEKLLIRLSIQVHSSNDLLHYCAILQYRQFASVQHTIISIATNLIYTCINIYVWESEDKKFYVMCNIELIRTPFVFLRQQNHIKIAHFLSSINRHVSRTRCAFLEFSFSFHSLSLYSSPSLYLTRLRAFTSILLFFSPEPRISKRYTKHQHTKHSNRNLNMPYEWHIDSTFCMIDT